MFDLLEKLRVKWRRSDGGRVEEEVMPEEGRKRRMEEANERKVGFEFGCDGSVEVDEVQKWSSQSRRAFVLEIWFSTRFFWYFPSMLLYKDYLEKLGGCSVGTYSKY